MRIGKYSYMSKIILVEKYRTKAKMYCAAEVIFYENFEKGLKTDPCEKSRPNTDIQWSI